MHNFQQVNTQGRDGKHGEMVSLRGVLGRSCGAPFVLDVGKDEGKRADGCLLWTSTDERRRMYIGRDVNVSSLTDHAGILIKECCFSMLSMHLHFNLVYRVRHS